MSSPAARPLQLLPRRPECAHVRRERGVSAAGTSGARGINRIICRQPSNTCVLILIAPTWHLSSEATCGKWTLILKGIPGLRLHWALQLGGWDRSSSSVPAACGSKGKFVHLPGLSAFALLAHEAVGLEKRSNPFYLQINPKSSFPDTILFPVQSISRFASS